MPIKSIRDMTAREKRRHSLAAKVFNATLLNCIIISVVALLIGLSIYTYNLGMKLVSNSFAIARNTYTSAVHGQADPIKLAREVMQIYTGLSEEELAGTGTEEYRARFAHLTDTDDFRTLLDMLKRFTENSDVDDVYLAMFDGERGALVYFVDPDTDEKTRFYTGEWEYVESREAERFLSWDGNGELYDISRTQKYGWLCTSGVPIEDESGEIAGFVLCDVSVATVLYSARRFALLFTVTLLVNTAIISFIGAKRMQKGVTDPINKIADACTSYMEDKKTHELGKDRFAMLNIQTGDEIENLSLVLADMERDMQDYVDDLTKVTAEKERINTELDMASKIQAAMLPHIFPAYPDRSEFDLYASMEPAKEVGGDFYDFFLIDDDHLCLVMADVSGKGVPAALFMMVTKVVLQSCAMLGRSVSDILNKTNQALCKDNQMQMFVTVWLGVLEISTGRLTTANAGHEYPALRKAGGSFKLWKEKHGFVIGGFDDEIYEEHVTYLAPGDKLFLYTDGVPEAMDARRHLFGTDRMLTALNKDTSASAHSVLINVRSAVNAFVKEAEQYDDLTMLCMEYKGPEGA